MRRVSKTLTAEGTFTDALHVHGPDPSFGRGIFGLRISGTFDGTVSVQTSDDGSNWYDTGDTYTAAGLETLETPWSAYFRAGFKTGALTSGSALIVVGQEN